MKDYSDDYQKQMHDYKDSLIIESRNKAQELGISGTGHNDTSDAFRHAYSSALVTYDYNSGIAYAAGVYNEWNSPNNPYGEDKMDIHNNDVGREIGSNASNREEIAQKVYEALGRGQLIIDPGDEDPSSPFDNDKLYTPPLGIPNSSFVEIASGVGSFNTSSLIRALSGGKKSRISSKQIFAMSAAAFAQELIKSRKRSLENDLLDILTGGHGKNTLAQAGNGNPMASLPNVFGGLIDNLIGSAMSRRKTRVSSAESDRSREAQQNWNLSRSQQHAMLASWAQQGNKNL